MCLFTRYGAVHLTRPRETRRLRVAAFVVSLCALFAASSTAHAQQFTLTVSPAPNSSGRGGVVSFPPGIDCTMRDGPTTSGTCSKAFNTGTVVTLVAQPANQDVSFTGYSGQTCGGGGVDCVLTMTQNRSVSLEFSPKKSYVLTFTVSGNGYGVVNQVDTRGSPPINCGIQGTNQTVTCTASYPATTIAKLQKTPGAAFASIGEFGGVCAGMALCTIDMDGPRSASAEFKSPAIRVQAGGGPGSGRVTSSVGGINCVTGGSSANGTCLVTYASPSQQNVTLTATPDAGSKFSGWTVSDRTCAGTGSCLISGPAYYAPGTVVSARFELDQYLIMVSGTGSGTVKSATGAVDCTLTANARAGSCDVPFAPGAAVTLTATAAPGWQFGGWGGESCSGTAATCQLTMSQPRSISVTFTQLPIALTVLGAGTGVGTVSSSPTGIACNVAGTGTTGTCAFQFPFETNVTLSATPSANNTFESWSAPCSGTGTCVVPMTVARTITATFKGTLVQLTVASNGTGSGIVTAPGGTSCRITKGVAATTGCVASATLGTTVTFTADPQDGSTFAGWSGVTCATSTATTCSVPVSAAATVNARFNLPPGTATLVDVLIQKGTLPADQIKELDRFGNNDNAFNLGDLLALLDRNGETISAGVMARLLDVEVTRAKSNRTTSPRRTP
ncbi:MAG TPA: hypothetical protein VM076_04855 [Gemmatimonadaceae bacterium]|nr:hypothetical protein [Gemmatimonadaceae bacterium]